MPIQDRDVLQVSQAFGNLSRHNADMHLKTCMHVIKLGFCLYSRDSKLVLYGWKMKETESKLHKQSVNHMNMENFKQIIPYIP